MWQLTLLERLDEDGGLLVQLARAVARGGHLDCVPELWVVHRVHTVFLGHYRHESVAPLDLLGHVRGASLSGDACGLHHTFQDHDDLQIATLQLHLREIVQRTVLIDDVTYDQGSQQEDAVAGNCAFCLDVDLMDGYNFALWSSGLPDHLEAHNRVDDHAFAQITHPDHEAQAVVAHGDDGLAAEDEGLGAPVGLGGLHEDAA